MIISRAFKLDYEISSKMSLNRYSREFLIKEKIHEIDHDLFYRIKNIKKNIFSYKSLM
jgi:hypothetical protein